MRCNGNCGGCSGCSCPLTLTEGELVMLQSLGQIPFLPVARKAGEETPVYLEEDAYSQEEYGLILLCLEKKGLIDIDYSKPLAGCSYEGYEGYPVRGSIALTARGQQVLETASLQGTVEDP